MRHATSHGERQTSKMVPSPTYWMSLSHTLHHLSPGSPNGHPESTRTKKERKEDSQIVSRIFQVKLWASSVPALTQNSQQGETDCRINRQGEKLGRPKPPSGEKWGWKWTIASFFLTASKSQKLLKERESERKGDRKWSWEKAGNAILESHPPFSSTCDRHWLFV